MARRSKFAADYDLFAYASDNNSPSIVYCATNILNGKRYIGMTRQTLKRRSDSHIAAALRNGDKYSGFHAAIRKYGAAAFTFEVVAQCASYRDAALEEMRLIAETKPEYNQSPGGEAIPNIGFRPSAASVEKMRKTLKANPTRYWLGKKRPDIAAYQRKRLTGRADLMRSLHEKAHTPEARAKMSATKRATGPSPKHLEAMKRRRKKIVCLNDGRIFIGSQAVADYLGYRQDTILAVLCGKIPHVGGFRLTYVEE